MRCRGAFSLETFAAIDSPRAVALADLDADGDLDAAITRTLSAGAGFTGELLVFRNDAGKLTQHAEPVVIPDLLQEAVAPGDLDGDGDIDLALGLFSSQVAVLLNDGAAGFHAFEDLFPLAGSVPRWVIVGDLNGDRRADIACPKNNDSVSVLLNLSATDDDADGAPDECPRFLRGDCDGDGRVSGAVTDALHLLNYSFLTGPEPRCLSACDANGDGAVLGAVTDAVYMLTFNFLEGPAPPEPFPDCGVGDRSDKALSCDAPARDCL